MENGKTEDMEELLNDRFLATMSYFDTAEAFYHGVMQALLQLNREYDCVSNRESGSGRFDMQCKQHARWKKAFVLEFKVSKTGREMMEEAKKAAAQIDEKGYFANLQAEGYETIMTYGFAFHGKRCRIVQGETCRMG